MTLEMQELTLPAKAEVKIAFSLTAQVNVTDIVAQRKVSKLLLDEVGNLLYGEHPSLFVGQRLLWRVPSGWRPRDTGPWDRSARWMSMHRPAKSSTRKTYWMKSRSVAMSWLTVPHLQQVRDGWCLPACVAMVAAYWQQPLTQADVANWLGTRDDIGTPAGRVQRLAQRGFDVIYRTGSVLELEGLARPKDALHSVRAHRRAAILACGYPARPGPDRDRRRQRLRARSGDRDCPNRRPTG